MFIEITFDDDEGTRQGLLSMEEAAILYRAYVGDSAEELDKAELVLLRGLKIGKVVKEVPAGDHTVLKLTERGEDIWSQIKDDLAVYSHL